VAEASGESGGEPPEPTHRTAALELVWRCLCCGELWLRQDAPHEACPNCGAPREEFVLVTED
jgi:rubrerythrin